MEKKIFNSNKNLCSPKRIKKKCGFCFGITNLVLKTKAKFDFKKNCDSNLGDVQSNCKTNCSSRSRRFSVESDSCHQQCRPCVGRDPFCSYLSYEYCNKCHKRKFIYLNKDSKLSKRYLVQNLNNFKKKLIFKNEFSFINFETMVDSYSCFTQTFNGSGLPKDFLKNYYISTHLSILPSSNGCKEILCGGIDKNEKLSRLKSKMEFVERYALTNLSFSSPIFINEAKDIKSFRYDLVTLKDFVNKYTAKYKKSFVCKKYMIMSIDFLKEKSVFIPIQTICDSKNFLNNYGFSVESDYQLTSSSGFAAHMSMQKAIENSVLELIERDAFIRWWMNPENCSVINVGNKVNKEVDFLASIVKDLLDQDVYIKFLLLPSPVDVPVVFAFLSSIKGGFPAMLVGASAAFDLNDAIEKSFLELKIAVLNFIARFQKEPNWLNSKIDLNNFENIKEVQDHAYFYHHPKILGSLSFLKMISKKKPLDLNLKNGPKNIDQLKIKMVESGINWYVIDFTPKKFEKVGVFVVKSFIPQFYILFFGGFWPFKCFKKSKYSVAKKLPHCFP